MTFSGNPFRLSGGRIDVSGNFTVDVATEVDNDMTFAKEYLKFLVNKKLVCNGDRTKPAKQELSVKHVLADGMEAVYLVFELKVSCGVDIGDVIAAQVLDCDFKFRPEHP